MALALILRNSAKLNGASFFKATHISGLMSSRNMISTHRSNLTKPLFLVKNVPVSRNVSLSAPKLAAAGSNHTPLWTAERFISLALLGVLPGAFLFPSQALDALMAVSVVLHTHWGVEAMVIDYLRPAVVGTALPKIAHAALYLVSIATLGGLFYFIYNDIGIAKTVKQLWAIKGYESNEA